MMSVEKGTLSAEVTSVRQQFRDWRATRKPGSAMPAELWTAAVRLAREHGPYEIARSLPVDYGALKKRMEAEEADRTPRFVEFTPPRIASPSDGVAMVELVDADGTRMTVRVSTHEALDVVGLVNAFRRRGA
jgi:hypothetical protein